MECARLELCPFVKHCKEVNKESAANGFINLYCKGGRQDQCIRLQLCDVFGKEIVPHNMMPNGFPLSGTDKSGWDEKAANFQSYL